MPEGVLEQQTTYIIYYSTILYIYTKYMYVK